MRKFIFTTSWDDGYPANLKLASLLNKYNLKGTFYISGKDVNDESRKEILEIANIHEIGAHTFSHPKLTQIDKAQVQTEIKKGKEVLEQFLGQPVKMFAYPYGLFNDEIKNIVIKVGFLGARTTQNFVFEKPKDFFEWATTFQVYPFPFRKRDAHHLHGPKVVLQPLQRSFKNILKLKLHPNSFFSWQNITRNLFDHAYDKGQIFHLFGHAYEIEKYEMWEDLESFFKYVSEKKDIEYLTNSEVLERLND